MATVIVFHHALGLTSGMQDLAEQIAASGHTVHTPDLYEGRTFTSLEEGVAHVEDLGFGTLIDRGRTAVEALPSEVVYVGFSLGVLPAQMLAQTRAGARGAVLCHSCVAPTELGGSWPDPVPVQIHGMESDPFFAGEGDIEAARSIVATAPDAELFVYEGDAHLFAEPSLPSHHPASAALLMERMLGFLERVG